MVKGAASQVLQVPPLKSGVYLGYSVCFDVYDDPACPGITRSRQAVSNLLKLGMIREDGRSIREGLSARDEQALFYTEKDMRELVDMLVMQVI